MATTQDIGARLREARQARGLSLRSVAQELGVSASLISQVETGKTQPSVATLYSLASLLGVSVDDLLGIGQNPPGTTAAAASRSIAVQRETDNPMIEMENGVRWERLAMSNDGPADALLVTYQPGASSSLEGKLMRHSGVEYAYIFEGVITLQLEFDVFELTAGDSLHFDSTRPHMFSNRGTAPARGIWFVVGRRDSDGLGAFRGGQGASPAVSAVDVLQRLDSIGQES